MIKRVGIFSLARGKDPEEVWKFYAEVHAPDVASRTPGLRKYVINRAVKPWIERRGLMGGEPRWWGILEQWYDSEEAFNQAASMPHTLTASQQKDMEVWASYIGERFGEAIVEEKVLINNPMPEKHCKRLGVFGLREGKDPEEAWKYWTEIHAVNWKDTMPGCRLYAINRVVKAPRGTPNWWGLLEQRFDSREASEQAVRTPRPSDEFVSRFMDLEADASGIAYVEEKVIV